MTALSYSLSQDENRNYATKIVTSRRDIARIAKNLRVSGKRVVFTNGCFDILHCGHTELLERARLLGDFLIVGVNTDESVRTLKGEGRPINGRANRMKILAALASVGMVVPFGELTATTLLRVVQPDIYVKGGDYRIEELEEAMAIGEWGGETIIFDYREGLSTTNTIERVRNVREIPVIG